MLSEKFLRLIKEIQKSDKEFKTTPREILDEFGCVKRTKWNLVRIDNFLEENKLETIPNYTDNWIDGEMELPL